MKYSTVTLPFGVKYVFKNTDDMQKFFEQSFERLRADGFSTKVIGCVMYIFPKKPLKKDGVCDSVSANKEVPSAEKSI